MLHELSGSAGNVIGLQADGPLTVADYQTWVPELLRRAESDPSGRIRVLIEMAGFEGWDSVAAFWEEIKSDAVLIGKVERLAIVAHSLADRLIADAAGVVMPGRVKAFDEEEMPAAWAWLKATESDGTVPSSA
ncbi:STAS/SEC14 domain-containing protein [Amorphus orientalis]|uniref:STAS/SEC14 domain-containing protein n=1 Tax=Amorphus orientalis TaxID=649198 RepID=A0AAE4ATS5_9HYPH|nr:STAS/SEC14 domain-containing protein [Amorphus orientalis]MDQ0315254.1 hypothetical protein [Amorphus orientalis]